MTINCSGGDDTITVSLRINEVVVDPDTNARVIDTTPSQIGTKIFLFTDVNLDDEDTMFDCALASQSMFSDSLSLIVLRELYIIIIIVTNKLQTVHF